MLFSTNSSDLFEVPEINKDDIDQKLYVYAKLKGYNLANDLEKVINELQESKNEVKLENNLNFTELSSNDLIKNTTIWAIRIVADFMENYIYKTVIRFKRMFESQNKENPQTKTSEELIINFSKSKTEKYMDIIKTISTKVIY